MNSENPIECVIFDMDGTNDCHARAWVDAFHNFGHEVAFEVVRKQIGKGGDQLMRVFLSERELAEYGKDLKAHRARLLKESYTAGCARNSLRGPASLAGDDGEG